MKRICCSESASNFRPIVMLPCEPRRCVDGRSLRWQTAVAVDSKALRSTAPTRDPRAHPPTDRLPLPRPLGRRDERHHAGARRIHRAGARPALEDLDREPETSEAGGIYLFADRPSAEAYLAMHTERLVGFGVPHVNAKLFEVNRELSAIDRAPIGS
ncbi:MAG: YdhR family protein [Thiocapsa sp. C4-3m]